MNSTHVLGPQRYIMQHFCTNISLNSFKSEAHRYSPLKIPSWQLLLVPFSLLPFCPSDLANMTLSPPADNLKANTAINTAAFGARIPESCQYIGMRAPLEFHVCLVNVKGNHP